MTDWQVAAILFMNFNIIKNNQIIEGLVQVGMQAQSNWPLGNINNVSRENLFNPEKKKIRNLKKRNFKIPLLKL